MGVSVWYQSDGLQLSSARCLTLNLSKDSGIETLNRPEIGKTLGLTWAWERVMSNMYVYM